MIDAHKLGRVYAAEVFATAAHMAMNNYGGDQEATAAFLASILGELCRLSNQHRTNPTQEESSQ